MLTSLLKCWWCVTLLIGNTFPKYWYRKHIVIIMPCYTPCCSFSVPLCRSWCSSSSSAHGLQCFVCESSEVDTDSQLLNDRFSGRSAANCNKPSIMSDVQYTECPDSNHVCALTQMKVTLIVPLRKWGVRREGGSIEVVSEREMEGGSDVSVTIVNWCGIAKW